MVNPSDTVRSWALATFSGPGATNANAAIDANAQSHIAAFVSVDIAVAKGVANLRCQSGLGRVTRILAILRNTIDLTRCREVGMRRSPIAGMARESHRILRIGDTRWKRYEHERESANAVRE